MTDGILSTCEAWTGDKPLTCPWRAMFDPFVRRVIRAYRAFESGNLAWVEPQASHRTVEGVMHYDAALTRCNATRMKQEAEARRNG